MSDKQVFFGPLYQKTFSPYLHGSVGTEGSIWKKKKKK